MTNAWTDVRDNNQIYVVWDQQTQFPYTLNWDTQNPTVWDGTPGPWADGTVWDGGGPFYTTWID